MAQIAMHAGTAITFVSCFDRCPACRYVLSNIETRQGLARGDRVWQIAFGSGFKCNSAVWRALRSTNEQHKAWVGVKVSDSDV